MHLSCNLFDVYQRVIILYETFRGISLVLLYCSLCWGPCSHIGQSCFVRQLLAEAKTQWVSESKCIHTWQQLREEPPAQCCPDSWARSFSRTRWWGQQVYSETQSSRMRKWFLANIHLVSLVSKLVLLYKVDHSGARLARWQWNDIKCMTQLSPDFVILTKIPTN